MRGAALATRIPRMSSAGAAHRQGELAPLRQRRPLGPAPARALVVLAATVVVAACQPAPEELRRRADVARAAGDYGAAAVELKNLLQRQPQDPTARAELGEVYLATGDAAAAETELRRALRGGAPPARITLPLCQALLAQG
jgi:predicted Zn-dependent protease